MAYTSKAKFTQDTVKNINDLIKDNGVLIGQQPDDKSIKIQKKFDALIMMVDKAVQDYPDDPQKQMDELTKQGADIRKVYINKGAKCVRLRDPNKFGFDEYDIKEIMKLADTRIERLAAPTFLKSSIDANMRVITSGGNKSKGGSGPSSSELIQSSIYNTLFRSFDRKWNVNDMTMSTDGKTIFMNPYITLALSLEGLKFTIAHEIMHIVLSHVSRFNEKYIMSKEEYKKTMRISPLKAAEDKTISNIFNIAMDLIINSQLVKDRWGEIPKLSDFAGFGEDENDERPGLCYIDGFENYTENESIVALGNSFCRTMYDIYIEMCKTNMKKPSLQAPLPNANNVLEATENIRKMVRLMHEHIKQQIMKTVTIRISSQDQQEKPKQGEQSQQSQPQQGQQGDTEIVIEISANIQNDPQDSQDKQGQSQQDEQDEQDKSQDGQDKQDKQDQSQQVQPFDGSGPSSGRGSGSGGGLGGGQSADEMAADIVMKIADSIMKNEAGSSNTLDSHEESKEQIKKYAKEKGYSNESEAIKNDVNLNVKQLLDAIMEDLASKGVTPEDLMRKGYGCVGSNVAKAWHVKKDQPHRDYKIEVMEFVKRINGEKFNTWDKWNKKNNALRSASRSIARKGGAMRTLLIPSTYNTSGRIIVAIDTSGSIFYDEASMKFAASEIMRLTGELQKRKGSIIDIVCCDTQITDFKRLKSGTEEFREYIDEIEKKGVKMSGDGGTDLTPIWDMAMDKDERFHEPGVRKPDGMILVTDTQTANANGIANMYSSGECTIPTMVLVPNEECIIEPWKDLESQCRTFGIGIISELLKKELMQGYDINSEPER